MNSCDMVSAPTGCAAGIIDGATHFRSNSIPTKQAFVGPITNINSSKVDLLRYLKRRFVDLWLRIMDEHSQAGRPMWGWLRNGPE